MFFHIFFVLLLFRSCEISLNSVTFISTIHTSFAEHIHNLSVCIIYHFSSPVIKTTKQKSSKQQTKELRQCECVHDELKLDLLIYFLCDNTNQSVGEEQRQHKNNTMWKRGWRKNKNKLIIYWKMCVHIVRGFSLHKYHRIRAHINFYFFQAYVSVSE